MITAYWIVGALLALMYLYSGGMKVFRSKAALRPMMGWVDSMPFAAVKTIGGLEILGAVGLILPPLTHVAVGLALAAAVGFVVLQVLAIGVHVRRAEWKLLPLNAVLLVLAAVEIRLSTVWL